MAVRIRTAAEKPVITSQSMVEAESIMTRIQSATGAGRVAEAADEFSPAAFDVFASSVATERSLIALLEALDVHRMGL